MRIRTVTVIGANGTMGRNVSAIFASFGNAKVYMVSRTMEKAYNAVDKAVKSVKADSIRSNLLPTDFTQLAQCIQQSDLIFESVAENITIKENVNREIAQYARPDTVICSGTSGLSINQLSQTLPEDLQKNYMGVHFYNPPYSMTLCELIPSEKTDSGLVKEMQRYLSETLYRTTVQVKDTPAFMGNRIGFQFINEALQYAEKYKDNGGIDYIDAILGQFTGRSMAPLATADFVGLDVHKAIVDNIYQNTNDYAKNTFRFPEFADQLVKSGNLGRKSGQGLFKADLLENGKKKIYVYDIASQQYREVMRYVFPFAENMISAFRHGDYREAFKGLVNNKSVEAQICLKFMLKYVIYSLNITKTVGDRMSDADNVMAAGFNWTPPLSVVQALGGSEKFRLLAKERLSADLLEKSDLDELMVDIPVSEYDFRRYFKAKH